jgi:hypothetical protein
VEAELQKTQRQLEASTPGPGSLYQHALSPTLARALIPALPSQTDSMLPPADAPSLQAASIQAPAALMVHNPSTELAEMGPDFGTIVAKWQSKVYRKRFRDRPEGPRDGAKGPRNWPDRP